MSDINSEIIKLLNDEEYQKMALNSFNQGKFFGVFDNNKFRKDYPYIISEENFFKIIEKACKSEQFKEVFINIEPFIMCSENITDALFEELLAFAKDKNEWVYLGLCHANLSEEKNKRLKKLGLNDSLWY